MKTADSSESWLQELPAARMPKPQKAAHRAKYLLWRFITPVHPKMRRVAERAGLRSERFAQHERPGRQKFLLGTLAPGVSVRALVDHLVKLGYGNHFVAWHDAGQIVSLRLVEHFTHQYHVRIFNDGEVRGHYEFTPECHPLRHLVADKQEDRRDVFYEQLGSLIVRADEKM